MRRTVQITQVLSLSFMGLMPTSGECLNYCRSMSQRHRRRTSIIIPQVSTLRQWASEAKPSFIVTESDDTHSAKDFLVELILIIRQCQMPILWALQFPDYWNTRVGLIHILQSLVLQDLQCNQHISASAIQQLSATDEED